MKPTYSLAGCIVMTALSAMCAELKLWMREGVLPETRFDANIPKTACKWLWNAEKPVTPGGESFFRRTFTLSAPVAKARFNINIDDRGETYLNGHRIVKGGADLAKHAVQGRNVLAVHAHNVMGPGGVIFSAWFTYADGKEIRVFSDKLCRGVAAAPADWMSPGFDDSAWKPAMEQGDATLLPWSQLRDYLGIYGTPEERAAITAARDSMYTISGSIASEPDPVCSVVYKGGSPFIRVNGRDYEPNLNLAGGKTPFALTVNMKTHALAFPFHELQFSCPEYETDAGKYDFAKIDAEAKRLLHFVPDAYIFLRVKMDLPKWCAAHPEECIAYGSGHKPGDEFRGTQVRPSAASRPFRAEVSRFFDQFGAFVRAQPWAKRVVAIRPCWGVYTEWHTYGMYNAPDMGSAMTAAFQRFDKGRHVLDALPTPDERRRAAFMLDPVKDAKSLAYHRCMSDETTDLLLGMMRDVKRNFPGRLAGCYCGYVYTPFPPEGQNCRYDRLMTAPELDFCSCPAAYSHEVRCPGGSYMQRAVPDAFRRHGKLLFLEDDMRFHHVREWVPSHQYCTKTPEESAAVMRRDWLVKFLDGTGIQLCDPFNGVGKRMNTFDHPSILGAMEESINAVAQAGPLPVESGNDILVISDVSQRFKWTAAISARKILRNVSALLPHNLQTTGAAVDMATLADYLARDYPHRLVYVMDACNLAAADRALLEKKTSRPGVQAYRFALPDVADVSPSNAPALPLPDSADAWRKMFKEHGAHLYGESGSWLRRRGNLIAYATGRAGHHRLTLKPGEKGATELFSGRHFTGETIEFDTDIPQTWLFKVEPGIRPDANPDLTNHFLDMEKPVYYFAAKPLSEGDPCTVAMVVVHGWGGRPTWAAPEALRFREAARKMLGADAVQPFVITPSFPRRVVMKSCGVEEDGRAVWNDSWEVPLTQRGSQHDDWRGGGDARGTKLSSFDVIDRIFAELSDRKRYPNLKRVVLAGFSAGGQFVGRYAAVGKGRVRDGVEVVYMALSPSTELRLDDDVAWHYGLKDRPRYSRDLTRAQIYANLSSRRVWRACGVNDVLGRPHTSLDNCPEANLQGNNRLHRFRNFKEYLKGYPEWQKMVSFYEIPEIGHKCQLAFVDPSFVRFALGL